MEVSEPYEMQVALDWVYSIFFLGHALQQQMLQPLELVQQLQQIQVWN